MKRLTLIVSLLLIEISIAGTKEYVVGSGSEFRYTGDKGDKISLSIYISESSFTKLGVEYFFSSQNDLVPVESWQQFTFGIKDSGLSLDAGFIQSQEMSKPEIMSAEFLHNNDGIKIDDFFFSKGAEIEKNKIGIEIIEVPAGSILATHYRKSRNDQTVDFWIADKAGAIGLVKLISKGPNNKDQNYTIELMSLLKNVKPKINPLVSVPLTEKGRMFLGKPRK